MLLMPLGSFSEAMNILAYLARIPVVIALQFPLLPQCVTLNGIFAGELLDLWENELQHF